MQEMIFIYNALQSGWNVEKIDYGKYKFEKKNGSDQEIDNFIKDNLKLNNLLKKNNIY